MAAQTPKPKRRRERGDDGISWDKVNKCYAGTISLGYDDDGKRLRRYRPRQDQARGQGQARRAARGDQGRHRDAGHLHHQAVRHGLARLARTRSAHDGHVSRPGREVDLSEDRRDEAGRTSRPPTPTGSSGTSPRCSARPVAGEDQEHAGQVDPASAEVRPHRQERRRARRPAAGPARAPVARHDRGAGQQGTPRPRAARPRVSSRS